MVTERYLKTISGLCVTLAVLAGCQTYYSTRPPESYIASYQDFQPEINRFQVCHDVDCENMTAVSLDEMGWQQLGKSFSVNANSAVQEREQIKSAIALFEEITGPMAKTDNDQARNTSGRWGDRQLDCIAETVNTTTYLLLLRQNGWLKWHDVGLPRHRGLFSLMAPHNTAVIREKQTGREFVVDSWFHKNGSAPEIVPLEQWLSGYDPDNKL